MWKRVKTLFGIWIMEFQLMTLASGSSRDVVFSSPETFKSFESVENIAEYLLVFFVLDCPMLNTKFFDTQRSCHFGPEYDR